MSFISLADRFEQRSKEIYNKFPANGFQPVVVKPDTDGVFGSRSRIKNDTQSIPTVSILRDRKRVSSFLNSADGRLFIAKQVLLQTANTFVSTKLYNPLSPLANVVPFIHIGRNISTKVLIPSPTGLLQNTTINTLIGKYKIEGALQAYESGKRGLLRTATSVAKSYLSTQLRNAANTIIPIPQTYLESRPEYKIFYGTTNTGPVLFSPQPLSQRGTVRLDITANIKKAITSKILTSLAKGALNRIVPKALKGKIPLPVPLEDPTKVKTFVDSAVEFRKKFYDRQLRKFDERRLRSKYFDESDNGVSDQNNIDPSEKSVFAKATSFYPTDKGLQSVYTDPYNKAKAVPSTDLNKLNYDNIIKEQDNNTDIIKFIFRNVDDSNPVYFRALLSSIKESIKTEFNEQRYVGRTERFVTYGGAKRALNLSFNIVAFSREEVEGMWSKINYLSGLAFPKDVREGFMIPPLFKMTVGGIYENQPCYIESLDYDFLDESITFDLDKEVPFAINVTMQVSILEKRSKFHDSPFYGITEKITTGQVALGTADQARVKEIQVATRVANNPESSDAYGATLSMEEWYNQQLASRGLAEDTGVRP